MITHASKPITTIRATPPITPIAIGGPIFLVWEAATEVAEVLVELTEGIIDVTEGIVDVTEGIVDVPDEEVTVLERLEVWDEELVDMLAVEGIVKLFSVRKT